MARQYGGKFSPDRTGDGAGPATDRTRPFDGRVPDTSLARPNFLFLTAVPLLFTAFGEGPVGMAVDLLAFAVLVTGFWLLREGLRAEMAYAARRVARRPALPRKLIAAVFTGLGAGLAGWDPTGGGIGAPVVYAGLAGILHVAAFGADPLRDKGMEGVDPLANGRVADAVERAEGHLAAMADAIRRAGDRDLERRVADFAATARRMFRRIEEDPRDLRAARRYLGIYLQGARDATVKFADLYARTRDPEDRVRYVALLEDLSGNFAARSDRLLLDDRSDLDIEIDVLRERLERENDRAR
ncbi:hypothetical protein BV394_03995 [Brevirhabdus pacifica]|uniref:Uncharacterized protein n=1 Tax=Brevirhabdus pacifica TaxID=1267768 RepID=A0A1U7DGG3_9RHOB|nr:5-bromo-4-chloroindolyl phosphate hydrolysis family protein [Brevirhabdus pacifica]APX88989.1 hypothetical protein BV394_03995 [Brevirhabdus pacifica]OWU80210.1 hypothetical protein ATO5_04675 [Loktanella sp. 22II-4b]PJJ86446.1 5-bromo-4-chloroindolyl phosphate hydrolysis protein [Brevirhabdus pacifica]